MAQEFRFSASDSFTTTTIYFLTYFLTYLSTYSLIGVPSNYGPIFYHF